MPMRIEILTLFPPYFESPLAESLLARGISSGLLEVAVTDIRAFSPTSTARWTTKRSAGVRGW